MAIKIKNTKRKVRVNVTVDKVILNKAKSKLNLFGGKLSTLFNAYLRDFVSSLDKKSPDKRELDKKIKDLENRIKKLEKK